MQSDMGDGRGGEGTSVQYHSVPLGGGLYSSRGAEFDHAMPVYRYKLWRLWDPDQPAVMFLMLNPSTADAENDDPTIRRCMGYAQDWGYGGLYVGNLFAFRTSSPRALFQVSDPVGPDNDLALQQMAAKSQCVILAWGMNGARCPQRVVEVVGLFREQLDKLFCLRLLDRSHHPAHPLYQRKDCEPQPVIEWAEGVLEGG